MDIRIESVQWNKIEKHGNIEYLSLSFSQFIKYSGTHEASCYLYQLFLLP